MIHTEKYKHCGSFIVLVLTLWHSLTGLMKYGFNNNTPGKLRSIFPLTLFIRPMTGLFLVDIVLSLSTWYAYFGLQASKLFCIPYLSFYKEWIANNYLDSDSCNANKYGGCNIFPPEVFNKLHLESLRTAISTLIKDPSFVLYHPRHIDEHIDYFDTYDQCRNRLTDQIFQSLSSSSILTLFMMWEFLGDSVQCVNQAILRP